MSNIFCDFLLYFLKRISLFLFMCIPAQYVWADLILTAPPREKPAAGKKLYGPLAESLSKILNEKVVYKHPGNWLAYQRDMRKDVYDIIFDGPHFISWRTKNIGHTPVIKLPGHLQFVIITLPTTKSINKPNDLIGKRLCGIPPPNLGTLSAYAYFKHPARLPVVVSVRGGPKKVYAALRKGKCLAAALPTFFVNKYIKGKKKHKIKVIYKTKRMGSQGVSVSTRVKSSQFKKIVRNLTRGNRIRATKNILARFGGQSKSFIPVKNTDYRVEYRFLEGVILGW